MHFDDEENFTDAISTGTNLLMIATHEFGHGLGLDHSTVPGSLTNPFYSYIENFQLHIDDILGIQNLYGKNLFYFESKHFKIIK